MEEQKKIKKIGVIENPRIMLFLEFCCTPVFCPDYNSQKNLSLDFYFYRTGIGKN